MPPGESIVSSASGSRQSLRALDWLNFFLADVQTGVGPFLAIYLAAHQWDEQHVGLALTVGGIAGIITQTPAGDLVDRSHSKRGLIAAGILTLAICALLMAVHPSWWPVLSAQALIGATSGIFAPAICAISLGLVGRQAFDRRQGRNQTFNSAGNVVAAVSMGLVAYYVSNRAIFFLVGLLAIPALLMLRAIAPGEIDNETARGANDGQTPAPPGGVMSLFTSRPLVIFLICSVMFHFANAAMLPLLGQMLAKGQGRSSMMFMAACVITTQLVVAALSAWSGRKAGSWGRKPLLLLAFGALPVRGVLYTIAHGTISLVSIQLLDGVAAAIFGVVSVLVVVDLTRGSGRFNLTLGAISTAVGIGAACSQFIAGSVVHHLGYNAGFLFLAGIAAIGFLILLCFMPETSAAASHEKRAA